MRRKAKHATRRRPARPRMVALAELDDRGQIVRMLHEMIAHGETSPILTGGDLDADWMRAHLSGEEAVGGSVATPDQDIVDEASDAEVRTSEEILRNRDRFRWHLEREAADSEEGRPPHPRRGTR
jgi:hypothetical protein